MSNNRTLGNLAQFLDSAASGSAISKRNGTIATIAMTDSDVGGVAGSGFTDSNLIKNIVDINHITKVGGITSSSDGIKAILQGNAPTTFNPSVTATYNIGDSSNPIDEIILDSSATIFFGAISLTSVLKSGTSAIAVAAAVVASPVAGSAETSFLLKTDSTQSDAQADASTNALTITENGNVTSTAFTPYHPKGYNISFNNSTNDELITATDNSFVIGTNDFTAEVWVYLTETLGSYNKVIWSGTGSSKFSLETQSTDNKLHVTDYHSTIFGTSSTALSVGVWTHVAVVRSSGTMKMYFDGTEVMSISNSTNFVGTEVRLARNDTTIILRDARLVVGTAVYTSAFTPPTEPLTAIANTKFLGANLPYLAYEDASGAGNAYGTIGGSPDIVPTTSPYDYVAYSPSSHGGSVYFDGSGDYMSLPANDGYNFGSGDFTLEAWLYVDLNSISSNLPLVGWGTGSYKIIRLSSTGINVESNSPSNASFTVSFPSSPQTKTWNHIALVRSGNSFTAYLNGVGGTAYTSYTGNIGNGSDALNISYKSDPAYYTGYMSDLRIIKGTAVYTADFTPPTEPLTAISGTQLLTCTNKNSVWDASRGAILTVAGNTTVSTTQTKYSSSSVYFDGTGDYITLPSNSGSFDFGTDNFTIEGWFYLTTSGSWTSYWGISQGGGASQKINLYDASGDGTLDVDVNGSVVFSSSAVLSDLQNKWAHIALVREGTGSNQTKLYVNGSVVGQGTVSTNFSGFSQPFTVGHNGEIYSGAFNGYISDFRVTKGLARYTTTFTPPTAALEG